MKRLLMLVVPFLVAFATSAMADDSAKSQTMKNGTEQSQDQGTQGNDQSQGAASDEQDSSQGSDSSADDQDNGTQGDSSDEPEDSSESPNQ